MNQSIAGLAIGYYSAGYFDQSLAAPDLGALQQQLARNQMQSAGSQYQNNVAAQNAAACAQYRAPVPVPVPVPFWYQEWSTAMAAEPLCNP